jgi:hypothetical protein
MTSRMDRRTFLQGVSVASLTSMLPASAIATTPVPLTKAAAAVAGPSKRSLINANFVDYTYDYQFINHILVGGSGVGPVSGFGAGGPIWNKSILDQNGWPNSPVANGKSWGNHILLPASSAYSSYIITWEGQGELQLASGTWTAVGGKSYTINGNGRFVGTNARVQVTYSGPMQQIGWRVLQTNQSGGGFFRNLKIFRAEDEADLNAGLIFRRGYKNMLVNLCPGAIRFMNWTGGNDAQQCRFESRAVPSYATYGGSNPRISPPYGETSGTNRLSLSAVDGMPAQMQHGEIAQARIGTGLVRSGPKTVSGVTRSTVGIVTAPAHGFVTGDQIVHRFPTGMTQLDYWPVTVTVIDSDHYSIGIDTTNFSNFTSGTAMEYVSLNVGKRGEYPVIFTDGVTPGSAYSDKYIQAGDYKTFYFDKTLTASRDSNGKPVYGVWMFSTSSPQNYLPYLAGVPLEICTALIRELNALSNKPIDMWITIPHWAMLSMDPDYLRSSNFAIGAVDVVLNGANGFGGLPSQSKLFVEYSNETWNWSFPQSAYLARRGYLRSPLAGTANSSYMVQLRSVIMINDIKSVYGDNPRLKFVLSGQGAVGIANGSTNYNRAFGTAQFDSDPLNVWSKSPIAHHDYWAWAAYVLAGPAYDTANLTRLAASYAANKDPAVQEKVCAEYVSSGVVGSGYSETVASYRDVKLPAYASALGAIGKATIMYEGGWDRSVTNGTAQVNDFLAAIKRSQAWADALAGFFDRFSSTPNAFMPSDYVMVDGRWGHTAPDTYGGKVEGGALDGAWLAASARNRLLP